MRSNNTLAMRTLLPLASLSLAILLTACSDNAKDETKHKQTKAPTAASIEIVANENAQEVKVQ